MANPTQSPKAVKRRKFVQKTVAVISVVILIITAAVLFFQKRVKEQFSSDNTDEVLSASVITGSIQTTVTGSGVLTGEGVVDVEVPDSVPLDTVYVESGDTVASGQVLASVKASDVLSALSSLQDKMKTLDTEIKEAKNDTVSAYITAGVSGRVKAVFAEAGDDVATVMYESGALALLSLDGKMSVTVPADGYTTGQSVTVTDSQGTEYSGTVDKITGEGAVIVLTDDGPSYGDTVTVDGTDTGILQIHQMLRVTGYAGTIQSVNIRVNGKVSSNTTMFTLTDTSTSANYDGLLAKRAEYEEEYQTLVQLYKDGAVLAPCGGTISQVPESSTQSASASYNEYSTAVESTSDSTDSTVQFTIDPGEEVSVTINVDETDILSLELGQTAAVTVESIGTESYIGSVTKIDTTATSSDGVTQYTAKITLERSTGMLSGMSADVSITIEGVENAMIVPTDAVHKTSTSAYVYTSYDPENASYGDPVEVTVGISNGTYTEITSGLKVGDVVYYTEKQDDNSFDFFFSGMNGGSMGGGMGGMPDNGGGPRG